MGRKMRAVATKKKYKLYIEALPNGEWLFIIDTGERVVRTKRIKTTQIRRLLIPLAKEWFKKVVK